MLAIFRDYAQVVLAAARTRRQWVFAHLAVPGVILAMVFIAGGGGAMMLDLESRIAVTPLLTNVGASGVTEHAGMAIIIDPDEQETRYVIPWRGPAELWSSLDPVLQRANSSRLRITEEQVEVAAPFFGHSQPVVIILRGEPVGEVLILGRRIPLTSLRLASRRSGALASWIFVAAIFAAALTSIWSTPAEHRS